MKRLVWKNFKGYNTVFHLLHEFRVNKIVMQEVFSLEVPKTITQLPDLLPKFNALKKIAQFYESHCEVSYNAQKMWIISMTSWTWSTQKKKTKKMNKFFLFFKVLIVNYFLVTYIVYFFYYLNSNIYILNLECLC